MSAEQSSADEATVISRLLAYLVHIVCRHPRLVLVLVAASVVWSVVFTSNNLGFLTQRGDLISSKKILRERWRQYIAEFGDDDDMVVVVKGSARAPMEQMLETLQAELAKQPELFDRVFYKVDLRHLQNRALLFLPTEHLQAIRADLKGMSLLLDPPFVAPQTAWELFTLTKLIQFAASHARESKLTLASERLLTQLDATLDAAAYSLEGPQRYRSPWQSILPSAPPQGDAISVPQYFFSQDGQLAFLLVRPAKDVEALTSSEKSIVAIRALVARLNSEHPEVQLGLTGLPVLEHDEMVASQSDTTIAAWLAMAGVALLYLVVYRSWRYPLLTVVTLMVGIAWALGWTTWSVGHLNILSATFAVMLIGLGDYGVLWVTRYEQERALGLDLDAAMQATALHVGPSVLTAAITTALSFLVATLTDFQAVAELGWIAGSGLLLCALACYIVLPAMLCLVDQSGKGVRASMNLPARGLWLPMLLRRPQWVVGLGLACTLLVGGFALHLQYDHNLLRLQSSNLDSVRWELTLIEHTAGASWHALSYTSTPEEALELKRRFEQLPSVSRVVEVASLVPRGQDSKLEVLRDLQERLRRLPPRHEPLSLSHPDLEELGKQLDSLLEGVGKLPATHQDLCARLRAHAETLKQRLAELPPEQCEARLQHFTQMMCQDLLADLHKLREVSTPAKIELGDLPTSLRERYIGKNGKWLLRVFGKESLWEYSSLAEFVRQVRTVDSEVTGKPLSTLEGLDAMHDGFLWAARWALLAMFVVLLLDFRHMGYTLLALLPLAMGLLLALGVMGLCGVHFNPANMIALPLLLGIGVDNGVHILHDYLLRPRDRPYALSYATGRGVMVAALTTILGFGTLMISTHRGLASLGLILALGVTCCMVSALLVLPALLRWLCPVQPQETAQILPLPAPHSSKALRRRA